MMIQPLLLVLELLGKLVKALQQLRGIPARLGSCPLSRRSFYRLAGTLNHLGTDALAIREFTLNFISLAIDQLGPILGGIFPSFGGRFLRPQLLKLLVLILHLGQFFVGLEVPIVGGNDFKNAG